jgi:hypothetical protein
MATHTTDLQSRLQRAIELGQPISISEFSESELLADAKSLALSRLFGDATEAFVDSWSDLDSPEQVVAMVCTGLCENADRDSLIHAIDSIATGALPELRPFVMALDQRVRDTSSPPLHRVEAATGLVRIALQESRWASFASTAIVVLEVLNDPWAEARLCRLASILSDHLGIGDATATLRSLATRPGSSSEAAMELGFLEMTSAFRCENYPAMAVCMASSAEWFRTSEQAAEEDTRSRLYAMVASLLASALVQQSAKINFDEEALKQSVLSSSLLRRPRAGAEWLFPPVEAELEWLPLVSNLVAAKNSGTFDLTVAISDALHLFCKVRAVQVISNGTTSYVPPRDLSWFALENQTVGSVRHWLRSPDNTGLTPQGIAALSGSLKVSGDPPGKPQR